MALQCPCGDIYCPNCGNPEQVMLEEAQTRAVDALMGLITSLRMHEGEIYLFTDAGAMAVLKARLGHVDSILASTYKQISK